MTTENAQRSIALDYFDFHGGRGEPARLAMAIGDIPFEDRRIKLADWPAVKPTTPFGKIPVLEVDGERVSQSNGINRFVGKLAGLYPDDPWQAALCDEVMGEVEDIAQAVVATFPIEDPEEMKAARGELVDGPLTRCLTQLNAMLEKRGDYFADGRLTVADLRAFVWVRHMQSGKLDHIPTDLAARVAPLIAAHHDRIAAHPKIVAYYARVA